MKKTTFANLLAIAALAVTAVSCSSEDVADNALQGNGTAITMQPYITGVSGRASHVASTKDLGHDFHKYGFSVWVNVREGATNRTKAYMTDQKVTYNAATSEWTYAPIKFWPTEADTNLDFYPIWKGVPGTSDEKNIQIYEQTNGNIPHTTFYVNSAVKNQSDFIWASPILGAERSDYEAQPVNFQFNHATTAFEFALKVEGIDESVTRVAVENVTLSGHFAPKAYVNAKATTLEEAWTYENDYDPIRSYTISDPDEEIYVGAEPDATGADYYKKGEMVNITRSGSVLKNPADESLGYYKGTMMLLPYSNDYTVSFTYSVYSWPTAADKTANNSNYVKKTFTVSRDVDDVELKLGYLYQSLITLNLLPIEFGASLQDWNIVTRVLNFPEGSTPTPPADKKVTGITLDKTTLEITLDGSIPPAPPTLVAIVAPADASDKTVTWSSSNPEVATVSASGEITAVKAGTAIITATANDGSGVSASCTVTVKQLVTSVTLNKSTAKVDAGEVFTLTTTVAPSDATNKALQWTSSDATKAEVDQTGKVTTKAAGTVTITATAKDGSGKSATCTVTVNPISGTAKRTGNIDVKWVKLWKDGPKFAVYNVGATSETGYGCYYCWGGNVDKQRTPYNTGNVKLTGDNDTATKLWGSNWRMPTIEELTALCNTGVCTSTWTDNYKGSGVKGRIFTGKGIYAGNSIFLPASGRIDYWTAALDKKDVIGRYYSSTPSAQAGRASFMGFDNSGASATYDTNYQRDYCNTVRAVLAE